MAAGPDVAKENHPPASARPSAGGMDSYSGATGGVPASLAMTESLP